MKPMAVTGELAQSDRTAAVDPAAVTEDGGHGLSPASIARRRARSHTGLQIGCFIILAIAIIALLAPWLSPFDPYAQNLAERLLPPVWVNGGNWTHLLGTDHLGRDYLSRLLYGARVSLGIGFGAASIGCVIGVALGLLAGYFGGRIDQVINFVLNCKLAMPHLLLIMALVFVLGPSVTVVVVVIGMTHWTFYLLVTRATTLQLRELDFVAAARAIGCSRLQIMLREILPNVANQIIVIFTLEVGNAMLSEAALSFLGLGVPAPIPSWGLMIAEGKAAMFFRPWLVVIPGIALFVLVIAINLLGDGIRDVTAPDRRT